MYLKAEMLALIICSVLAGVCITLLTELLLCYKWFTRIPVTSPSWKTQTEPYVLPKALQISINETSEADRKETCVGVNLLIQFLFQELKDTRRLRRWVMKRMQKEFVELLQQSTTGKLLENITVRDFNLGSTFPIIRHATTSSVDVNDDNIIESVALLLDLSYNGRFQLAVDVDMVFGRSVYLSVMVTRMVGVARLQFTRVPFTHWSFAFTEEPTLEFEVESQLEGRPIAQLASIIINQIRRTVRKKHTLPFYKLRYKPFFTMPAPPLPEAEVYYDGQKLTTGHLCVNVVSCSRLIQITSTEAMIYCSLSVDALPWVELMVSRRKQWEMKDIVVNKTSGQAVGMTFIETHIAEKCEELIAVTAVIPGSPADSAHISKNDILVSINGVKVLSTKQAARLIKQSPDRIAICIERLSPVSSSSSTMHSSCQINHTDGDQDINDDFDSYTDFVYVPDDRLENRSVQSTSIDSPDAECSPLISTNDQSVLKVLPTVQRETTASDFQNKSSVASARSETGQTSLVPKSDASSPSGSQSSLSKVGGAMPPVARKIINSSSALFQRKKQAIADHRKSSSSNTSVAHAVSSSESSTGNTFTSVSYSSSTKSVFSSPAIYSTHEVNKSASPSSLAATAAGKSLSSSVNSLPAAVETSGVSLELYLANVDSDLVSLEQLELIRPLNADHVSAEGTATTNVPAETEKKTMNEPSPVKSTPVVADIKLKAGRNGGSVGTRKTRIIKACSNPAFNQKFEFDVGDKQSYLNVCVWCRLPEKLDKQQRFVKPQKDVVIGHTSVALADIALNSVLTLQGDFTETFTLTPPESNIDDITKNNNANLSTHPGFNEHFCYGDITLRLHLQSDSVLSRDDRSKLMKRSEDDSSIDGAKISVKPSSDVSDNKLSSVSLASGKQHHFALVHFQSATYCNFCSKKIWFKSAFQCSLCPMVCHKKCVERCQLTTNCSRVKPNPLKLADTVTTKPAGKEAGEEDSSKGPSCAPEESHSDSESANSSSKSSIKLLPRPRSSNSLQELLDEPTIEQLMSAALVNEADCKLVKLFERAKRVENNDELVVTKAKKMGKELFAELDPESRKQKLDSFISKLQSEIDCEAEHRAELARSIRGMVDKKLKSAIEAKIEKSDEKLDSMTVLMLHYCAGLQHCLDQEEVERQKQAEGSVGDVDIEKLQDDENVPEEDIVEDSDSVQRVVDEETLFIGGTTKSEQNVYLDPLTGTDCLVDSPSNTEILSKIVDGGKLVSSDDCDSALVDADDGSS